MMIPTGSGIYEYIEVSKFLVQFFPLLVVSLLFDFFAYSNLTNRTAMAHTLITTVLPFIGIVTSNLIALTLVPTLQSAWKTRTIFPKAPTPILFLFPPQLFFLLFAYITGDINILFANALPCIIGAAAVIIMFRCQDVSSKIGAQIIGAAIIIAIIEAYIAVILQLESAYVLVGKESIRQL